MENFNSKAISLNKIFCKFGTTQSSLIYFCDPLFFLKKKSATPPFFLPPPSIYLSLHRVPKDVGSMNKISQSVPILSIPVSLKEGAASNDIIFPSLPWSSLSVGTRDHFHKNAFGKTHVAHSAYMAKPGQLRFSDARILLGLNLQEEILKRTSSLHILSFQVMLGTFL